MVTGSVGILVVMVILAVSLVLVRRRKQAEDSKIVQENDHSGKDNSCNDI